MHAFAVHRSTFSPLLSQLLKSDERVFALDMTGKILAPMKSVRAVRREWTLAPTSLYAWYTPKPSAAHSPENGKRASDVSTNNGVVQMKNAKGGSDFFASNDPIYRFYALGGSGSEEGQVGNHSFDYFQDTSETSSNTPSQTVLMSSSSGSPYWSGLQTVLAGGFGNASSRMNHWDKGWDGLSGQDIGPSSSEWKHTAYIGPNNLDFPVGDLGVMPNMEPSSSASTLPSSDLHAYMTAIYGSPAGCLCTHVNEVAVGERVGQIATSIAQPSRGYEGTYNYFDPDNYIRCVRVRVCLRFAQILMA